MKLFFEIEFPWEPVVKGRPRFTRSGIAYTPRDTKIAEAKIEQHLKFFFKKPATEKAIMIQAEFHVPRLKTIKYEYPVTRKDLDNYLKLLMDSCNGIVFRDDCQVCKVEAAKYFTDRPRTILRVFEFDSVDETTLIYPIHCQEPIQS